MAHRRRRRTATATTTTAAAAADPVDDTNDDDYSPRAGNPVPGFGGLYLSRNRSDSIDPMDPRLNRWAMIPAIMQMGTILRHRPFASAASLLLAFGGLSLGLGVLKSTVLVATGRANPVTSADVSDPTSASQVGMWLGSQVGAPVLQSGSAALVNWSAGSVSSGQPAPVASSTSRWSASSVNVSTQSASSLPNEKIQLIPGRR